MEFDLQPTLTGERLLVRPIASDDWPGLFAAAADPKLWELHPASDRYKEDVFREFFDVALQSGSAFVVIDRETGAIIGSSRYNDLDAERSEIEIGWTFLSRDYWGGTANAELKALMLEHAFRFVDTVVFWVGETNWRSRRAMEKIGGALRDGTVRRPGATDNHVIYEIRRT
ncbi:MAG: GNAT family N-acetyltransferase [Woeseiaceae bacterium]|nr:GNAT family N-acetyltransferase [Woeseiaceae bacterium]